MGSSFITYREKGFWTHDTELQFLLKLALKNMVQNPASDPDLAHLPQIWQSVSTDEPSGALDLQLDEFVTDAVRQNTVLRGIDAALRDLSLRGDVITKEELSRFFGEPFRSDLPVTRVRSVGEAFKALLRGESRSVSPQIVSRRDPNWRGGES